MSLSSSLFDSIDLKEDTNFIILGHGRRKNYPIYCCPSSVNPKNLMKGKFIDNDRRTEPDILLDLTSDALPLETSSISHVIDTGGKAGYTSYYKRVHFWTEMARVLKSGGKFHGNCKKRKSPSDYPISADFVVIMVKEDNTFVLQVQKKTHD
jgi:hypothetical protein